MGVVEELAFDKSGPCCGGSLDEGVDFADEGCSGGKADGSAEWLVVDGGLEGIACCCGRCELSNVELESDLSSLDLLRWWWW